MRKFDTAILHLDLDAFFVNVELLRRPELRGQAIIIGGREGRGVVASCSYEARAKGVHSAMPTVRALRLCPEAVVIRPDMAAYSQQSRLVRDFIAAEAPAFEQVSIDEFNLDLSGMDTYIGCWQWSRALRRQLQAHTGLPLSMGLASNKTVAKIAAGAAKPNGEICVEAGTEAAFLAPMPVSKIPMVGQKTEQRLLQLGISTIGKLANTPLELLEHDFGNMGRVLWAKAQGIHQSPINVAPERVSMSHEHTFHEDIAERGRLHEVLREQVIRLGFDLRKKQQFSSCVAIKLRYGNFETLTRQAHLPNPSNHDSVLIKTTIELFDKNWDATRALRLLGVRVSELSDGDAQLGLFDYSEKEARLLGALDKIRSKYGRKSIK